MSERRDLRFVGGRFDEDLLSVDAVQAAAVALRAYQDLIRGIATHLYRQENPRAKSLPKQLSNQLALTVGGFARGSLDVVGVAPVGPDPSLVPIFENGDGLPARSVAVFDRIVDEAGQTGASDTLGEMPEVVQRSAARIGSALNDDETLRIGHNGVVRSLDARTRQSLRPRVHEREEIDTVIAVRVIRVAADRSRATLSSITESWGDIEATYETGGAIFETLRSGLTERRDEGPTVVVRGVVGLRANRVDGAASLQQAHLLDSEAQTAMHDLLEDLDVIDALEDGWYDGDGTAPDAATVQKVRKLVPTISLAGVPFPHAFPDPDGSVLVEWALPDAMAAIRFGSEQETVVAYATNARTNKTTRDEDFEVTCELLRDWLTDIQADA